MDEKAHIIELLPRGTCLEEIDKALSILSHVHTGGATSEEDISEQDQVDRLMPNLFRCKELF